MGNQTIVAALKSILADMGYVDGQRTFDDIERLVQALENHTTPNTPHKDVRTPFERS